MTRSGQATPPLVINGRFLGQTLSGVQRFAYEMARELVQIWPNASAPPVVLQPAMSDRQPAPFRVDYVGGRSGVAWEQLSLPAAAAGALLLNLANTAPLFARRQAVIIHDAGAFETPKAYSLAFRTYYRVIQTLMARTGMQVVTVSEFSRQAITRHLGIPADRIAVVGEGADHMHRLDADPETISRHQLTPGAYVLAVGNLSHHKNLAGLVEVAPMLERRGLSLVIAGQKNSIFDVSGSRLPNPARYLGRVTDGELKALYQSAACFVFPSLYEGFGLPAVEAMASGCTVLASDIPGLRETCGNAALYFDPLSPADIAAKVAQALDEPGLMDCLRRNGTLRADELTWARAARLLQTALLSRFTPDVASLKEAQQ